MTLSNFVLQSSAAITGVSKASALVRCISSQSRSCSLFQRGFTKNGYVTGSNQLRFGRLHLLQTCNGGTLSSLTRVPVWSSDNNHHCNSSQFRTFSEDRKTTALTLIKDLKHLRSSPIPALVLGVAGAIPFAAAPAYIIFSGHFMSGIAFSQVAYGACILSFLGGVRWGLTVSPDESVQPDWFNLGYSVTPALVAWVGLMLPTSASILVLITGLLGACFMDVTMWGYPPWFKALRFLLTFLAVLSLWTTLMCRLLLMKTDKKKETKVVKEAEASKEKSSWMKLPWKSSKPKPATEVAKAEVVPEPIVEIPAKTEEKVITKSPEILPEVPADTDTNKQTEHSDKETVPEKKGLKW